MLLICKECSTEFSSARSSQEFCSRKCSITNRKKDLLYRDKLRGPKVKREEKTIVCKHCDKHFTSRTDRKYCSSECNNKDRLLGKGYLKPLSCPICSLEFKPVRSTQKYCSPTCSSQGKKEDPAYLAALSSGCKKRSQRPEYLQKLSEKATERWKTREFQEKMSEIFQSDEWIDKSVNSFNSKEYVFPSGRKISVQGYEGKAINVLLQDYAEEDIIVDKKEIKKLIGKIEYVDVNGKTHQYIPDIYIVTERKVVEVKSEWTYKINLETNLKKREAVLSKGISFDFMIL